LVLNFALENGEVLEMLRPEIFKDSDVKSLFIGIKNHHTKFMLSPTEKELENITKESKISIQALRSILNSKTEDYSREFLKSLTERLIIWREYEISLIQSLERYKTSKEIPQNAKELVEDSKTEFSSINLDLMDTSLGSDFTDVNSHFIAAEDLLSSGHRWIDNFNGGYSPKTLNVYCGFSNVGKSAIMCSDAANFVRRGFDVIYISAEMAEQKVMQRIGANLLDINIDDYRNVDNKFKVSKLIEKSRGNPIPLGNLNVKQFPTSCATVADIETYYKKICLVKGLNPRIIFIDYINILATKNKLAGDNMYMKIKSIAEELRAFAVRNNLIIVSATQLNRAGNDTSDISLSNIAESMGLVHTSDLMIGIIQTTEMNVRSEYYLKILKIRDGMGKNMRCRYEMDYSRMKLRETDEVSSTE
jgi:replicative DNA helicase